MTLERTELSPPSDDVSRRGALLGGALVFTMLGGLVAGYGTLASLALRFLFPKRRKLPWLFVAEVDRIRPGESFLFLSPVGVSVLVRREGESPPGRDPSFVALSSTCPHLGCQVHWEAHRERFFCPCHNGTFDPAGEPTGGPVLAAHQRLPRYPLKVEKGLLFIQMSATTLGDRPAEEHRRHRERPASEGSKAG